MICNCNIIIISIVQVHKHSYIHDIVNKRASSIHIYSYSCSSPLHAILIKIRKAHSLGDTSTQGRMIIMFLVSFWL